MLKTLLPRSLLMSVCAVGVCPILAQTTQPPKRNTQVKPPQPKVEQAHWSEDLESSFGISDEKFAAMGLRKLTVKEFGEVLMWAYSREKSAEEKGKEEAASIGFKHSCGRNIGAQAATDKVNLVIDASDTSNSEVVSGLRQKLRSISDVQIVYDDKEADLYLYVLALQNRSTYSMPIGYTLAMTITEACREWFGGNEAAAIPYQRFLGHVSSVGGEITEVVEPAAAELDAKYIESQRKSHALWRETLQKIKK